jgi:hypothetical protein
MNPTEKSTPPVACKGGDDPAKVKPRSFRARVFEETLSVFVSEDFTCAHGTYSVNAFLGLLPIPL